MNWIKTFKKWDPALQWRTPGKEESFTATFVVNWPHQDVQKQLTEPKAKAGYQWLVHKFPAALSTDGALKSSIKLETSEKVWVL